MSYNKEKNRLSYIKYNRSIDQIKNMSASNHGLTFDNYPDNYLDTDTMYTRIMKNNEKSVK